MSTRTGIHRSSAPTESKPSGPDRYPSWKTSFKAPKLAQRLRTFMTRALTGMTTDPVIRNSSSRVASATTTAAIGSRAPSRDLTSASSAAGPPTCTSKAGRSVRMRSTSAVAAGPWLVPVGTKSTTVVPAGVPGRTAVPATPGVPAMSAIHAVAAGSVGSTAAMTVTGSVPRAGNRSASTSAVARASDERGRVRASPFSNRAPRNGVPSSTSTTATAPPTATGRRCTRRASR